MTTDKFWRIIETSLEQSKGEERAQIESIKAQLGLLGEEEVISFERNLRERIIERDTYGIMAALKTTKRVRLD